jgi:hypothetical protein
MIGKHEGNKSIPLNVPNTTYHGEMPHDLYCDKSRVCVKFQIFDTLGELSGARAAVAL